MYTSVQHKHLRIPVVNHALPRDPEEMENNEKKQKACVSPAREVENNEKKQKACISTEREVKNDKKQKESIDRFLFDIDADVLSKYKEEAHNTEKNTEWALRNFEAWQTARNEKYPQEQCCSSVTANKTELCEWLCKFVS